MGPTVTDIDGNVYNTVIIGTQTWMVENLKVTHYRNGNPIQNVTDNNDWIGLTTGAFCWYNNDIINKNVYGALYNWYTVSDTRNICPTGWHVATDADWYALENYVDNTINDPNAEGWRGTSGATKLKSESGWNGGGNGTDNYGFNLLPSGSRDIDGTFDDLTFIGYYWTNSSYSADEAWRRTFVYNYSGI